ncbi:MAG: mechanosensitive ion channel family protein, partial [Akkermansiaceae bacterium]
DNSVNLMVRVWGDSSDFWGISFDLTEAVKKAFDQAGISFPYPQTDVHMHRVEVAD